MSLSDRPRVRRRTLAIVATLLMAVVSPRGNVRAQDAAASPPRIAFPTAPPSTAGSESPDLTPTTVPPFDPYATEPQWVDQGWMEPLPPIDDHAASAPRDAMSSVMGPGGSSRAPVRARLSWLPSSTLKTGVGSVALVDQQLDLAFPIRFESDGLWLGMFSLQSLEVDMDDVPTSVAAPLPNRFWDIEMGLMRIKNWDSGAQSGAMIRVGSPSDQPYAAIRDVTVSFLAFLNVPHGERNAWEFSLFYSPTGQIVFPIPGIAYRWRPNDRFQAQIGLPASFTYRPTDDWTFRGAYLPINQVQLEARRRLGESWDAFARFDTVSEAFFQADRVENQERTYFFDQRLSLGLRRRLFRGWSLEASAAYVFDRKIFDAESFSRDRQNVMSLDPTVGGVVSVLWER
ncbi:MAG: hypothetical protein U0939_18755 [Pirellulales bacterium]